MDILFVLIKNFNVAVSSNYFLLGFSEILGEGLIILIALMG